MLTRANIESELSYAYLHAIASRLGYSCAFTNRHLDDRGIDAVIQSEDRFLAEDSVITSVVLHVQLKATFEKPIEQDGKYSFSLKVPHYNQLRSTSLGTNHRILVIMYLPQNQDEWLLHSEEGLISRKCCYWVSLYGAPGSENDKHQTVYIPRNQMLSPASLGSIMEQTSRLEVIPYAG